ncbi:MAG: STAS domain-containing protein [Bacteroidales bacterium]|jgi:anti-sigma B factor antagonist
MELLIDKQQQATIICINGRLDTSNYIQLENELMNLITPRSAILIDCTGLDYVSSSGLRVLLLGLKKAEKEGAALALSGLQPVILEIFKISAFDKIFRIYADKKEALAFLHNQ